MGNEAGMSQKTEDLQKCDRDAAALEDGGVVMRDSAGESTVFGRISPVVAGEPKMIAADQPSSVHCREPSIIV
jgi:hypothetical protein